MGMIIHTVASLAEIKAEADCKAQDENKLTAFRLNVICPHTRFAGQKNNLYNGKG